MATMEYKDNHSENKKIYKTLTFRIRKGQFDSKINFIDTEGNSQDFYNVEAVKLYLREKYGTNKLIDWGVLIG